MAPKSSFSLDGVQDVVANVFSQVQVSTANHKKNCVTLYKLHVQAAGYIESTSGATVKLVGEDAFAHVFLDMVSRVLIVKKGVASADRIVRFIGSYVKYINEKVRQERAEASASTGRYTEYKPLEEDDEEEDTFVSRFVSRLLKWVLRGFLAKDKNVRYRSVFVVSEMILWLGELDMDIYQALRESLIERLCDKESSIRAGCTVALARLSGTEDPNDIEDGERSILELLTEVLMYDDEPEVRRAALVNMPLNRATVDILLSCSRDVDLLTRKLLYSAVLASKLDNPRSLTLVQREKVIKDGLGDREGVVRASASKLIMKWFDFMLAEVPSHDPFTWEGDDGGLMKGFIRFLELFDVIGSEQIASDALSAIFVLKPEYLSVFAFSDEYWKELTPESALLTLAFIHHSKGTTQVEEVGLPMVTAFAFYIQSLYNKLLEALQAFETAEMLHQEDDAVEKQEQLQKIASILSSLLSIATGLDYGDEIGRRKAFSVVKDMLTHPTLPLDLVDPCMDVMKAMLPSEREFIRVIVEIIIDLRDGELEEEEAERLEMEMQNSSMSDVSQSFIRRERSFRKPKEREEMNKDERESADLNDFRCLMICNSVLERVHGSFEDNSTLQGILDDLIIPSVQRKELLLREKALVGLGLCSLIAKRMALGSFQLFSNECMRAPDPIRIIVLRVIFDLMLMHEKEFFGKSAEMDSKLVAFLLSIMENELGKDEPSQEILAVLCIGFSKFLLLGIVDDSKMLLCLLVAFVSPDTAGNQEARQCLSYFFIRYGTAHSNNKIKLQTIFIQALDTIARMNESLDETQTMVTPEKVGEMLLAWADPQFGLEPADIALVKDNHTNIVIHILLALYDSERSDAEFKVLCHLLNQPMHWPEDLQHRTIHIIDLLLSNHETQCPFDVAATAKAFERFKVRFCKVYSRQLSDIDPRKYVHDDEILSLYQVINIDAPESDGETGSWSPLRKDYSNAGRRNENTASPGPSNTNDGNLSENDASDSDDNARQSVSRSTTPGLVDENLRPTSDVTASVTTTSNTSSSSMSANITPRKGTKRLRTPGGILTPADRKRNRARSPPGSGGTESESDGGNATPTPVKTRPRPQTKAEPGAESRPKQPQVKHGKAAEGEPKKLVAAVKKTTKKASTSTAAPAIKRRTRVVTSKSTKPATRRKRKMPTPPPPPSDGTDEGEESEGQMEEASSSRISPEPVEHSSDDLAAYSDES